MIEAGSSLCKKKVHRAIMEQGRSELQISWSLERALSQKTGEGWGKKP